MLRNERIQSQSILELVNISNLAFIDFIILLFIIYYFIETYIKR